MNNLPPDRIYNWQSGKLWQEVYVRDDYFFTLLVYNVHILILYKNKFLIVEYIITRNSYFVVTYDCIFNIYRASSDIVVAKSSDN